VSQLNLGQKARSLAC